MDWEEVGFESDKDWQSAFETLLSPPITQTAANCVSIAFVRNLEISMKLNGLLPRRVRLSMQELMNLPPKSILREDGAVRDLKSMALEFLLHGTVREIHCPFTQEIYPNSRRTPEVKRFKPSRCEVFTLEERPTDFFPKLKAYLIDCPICVRFRTTAEYSDITGNGFVFNPEPEETRVSGHVLLAASCGRVDGLEVLKCQDCQGKIVDDDGVIVNEGGWVYIALRVVNKFVVIKA